MSDEADAPQGFGVRGRALLSLVAAIGQGGFLRTMKRLSPGGGPERLPFRGLGKGLFGRLRHVLGHPEGRRARSGA